MYGFDVDSMMATENRSDNGEFTDLDEHVTVSAALAYYMSVTYGALLRPLARNPADYVSRVFRNSST